MKSKELTIAQAMTRDYNTSLLLCGNAFSRRFFSTRSCGVVGKREDIERRTIKAGILDMIWLCCFAATFRGMRAHAGGCVGMIQVVLVMCTSISHKEENPEFPKGPEIGCTTCKTAEFALFADEGRTET
jgi:hypothetical protein